MKKLDPDDLRLPASHGVRLVALRLLDDAGAATVEGALPPDEDALHAFRVAVRRLRSWLRAFRDELGGTVRRKDRRRLRDIARATTLGRDLDVQLIWLAAAAQGGRSRRAAGAAWLADHLAERRAAAVERLSEVMRSDFARVRAALTNRLATYEHPVRADDSPTLASAIAARLVPHADSLSAALDAIHDVGQAEPPHAARIEAKRLRYLLEPIAPAGKDVRKLLKQLKSLQDHLGALHDAHVLGEEIRTVIARAASGDAHRRATIALGMSDAGSPAEAIGDREPDRPPERALLALARHLQRDMKRSHQRVAREWLDGRHLAFRSDVEQLVARLRQDTAG